MFFVRKSAALTFPRLQENRVGHDVFNLHCQNPEQSRCISLSGGKKKGKKKDAFTDQRCRPPWRLLHARRQNATLAHNNNNHERTLTTAVLPFHCAFFNETYGAIWLQRSLLAFRGGQPSFLLQLPPPRPSSSQRTRGEEEGSVYNHCSHTFTHKCVHTENQAFKLTAFNDGLKQGGPKGGQRAGYELLSGP